jgi:SNF2 family DNA or RNA helicase
MLSHAPTQSLLLQVADPFQVRELLPKSKILMTGDHNIVIKHTVAATKILRNIGIEVPLPIEVFYDWPGKYKPFDHQKVMASFMTMHRRCLNLGEQGTGKTASALWAADWLMTQKIIRKVLVLAPLSTLKTVWSPDIFDVLMHRVSVIVHGTNEKRMQMLGANVDFYILNHDGVSIKSVNETVNRNPEIDLVIVDEGGMFRNHDTAKYKALVKMLRPDMRLWWLTGTPCPNAPTDVWSQVRLVNPANVPQFFGKFKRDTMMSDGYAQHKWTPRPEAYTVAWAAMQPAIRFKKADCLDLPPVVTVDRQAELSPEQRAAFKTMKNEMVMETAKVRAEGKAITAVHAADQVNKLRQICSGNIRDTGTGEYVALPHASRTKVLLEAIEGAAAKVIVIVPFKGIIQSLENELTTGEHSVGVLNGDVSPRQRDAIIKDFKTTPDPHILLCHPKVMAHGLNLVEADTIVFYAPIYSNDEFRQVIERNNRAGQTRKMTIVRIAAHPLEWEIYKTVDVKGIGQDNILKLYASVTN